MLLTRCHTPSRSIARHNEFDHLRGQMDRFFGDFASSWWNSGLGEVTAQFRPAVEVSETTDDYRLVIELPGVAKDDVKLTIKENELALTAEKKSEKKEEGTNVWRQERTFGTFSRSFSFSQQIDATKVSASFKDGVLQITVPKAEEAKPRTIDVAVQ